jgi:hypothetical protein
MFQLYEIVVQRTLQLLEIPLVHCCDIITYQTLKHALTIELAHQR